MGISAKPLIIKGGFRDPGRLNNMDYSTIDDHRRGSEIEERV